MTGSDQLDPAWRRLLAASRRKLERNSGELTGAISLRHPTDAERRVVIGITGKYRPEGVAAVRVELAEMDQALRAQCGAGLLDVLVRDGGRLRDRAAERANEAGARADVLARARSACPRYRDEPWFSAWLEEISTDGTLTRLLRREELTAVEWAAAVLAHLPTLDRPLPALAEQVTGNTKALTGTPLSTLVLRALARREGVRAPATRAEARARWEAAGVIVDDLASQVLVLNLHARGNHAVARWLQEAAGGGIPFRLTLHQLNNAAISPTAPDIYVCENPAVLRAAASQLAAGSATLVCTEGQPSAACHTVLSAATGHIHWRGDFDWTGLRTTTSAIDRYSATPWRMSHDHYLTALATGDSEPLKGTPAPSPWDPPLAKAMTEHGRAIMEERLIPELIEDLRIT